MADRYQIADLPLALSLLVWHFIFLIYLSSVKRLQKNNTTSLEICHQMPFEDTTDTAVYSFLVINYT